MVCVLTLLLYCTLAMCFECFECVCVCVLGASAGGGGYADSDEEDRMLGDDSEGEEDYNCLGGGILAGCLPEVRLVQR